LTTRIFADSQQVSTTSGLASILADHFLKAPIPFLKLIGIKLARVWYGSDANKYDKFSLEIQIPYMIIWVMSAVVFIKKNFFKLFLLVLPLVVYFWAMTIVGMPLLRYMVPVISLLFIFVPALFSNIANERIIDEQHC